MATSFLSNARTFLPSVQSSASSSSTSSSSACFVIPQKHNVRRSIALCKAGNDLSLLSSPTLSKRSLSISLTSALLFTLAGKGCFDANAAILEADDDEELLAKVKKDRQKRLEKQGVLSSASKEKEYLQDLVYKLSKVGKAIETNDLSAVTSLLGQSTDTEWVQKVNSAFDKLSSSTEEKTEVDIFNSSLASLISSVSKNDIEATKVAFVESASAFERWTTLSGLVGQLKGL